MATGEWRWTLRSGKKATKIRALCPPIDDLKDMYV